MRPALSPFTGLLLALLYCCCLAASASSSSSQNLQVEPSSWFFISPFGSDGPSSTGTRDQPFETLFHALNQAPNPVDRKPVGIYVMKGVYRSAGNFGLFRRNVTVRAWPTTDRPNPEMFVFQRPDTSGNYNYRFDPAVVASFTGVSFKGGVEGDYMVSIGKQQVSFQHCAFLENHGAAIYIDGGALLVDSSYFANNHISVSINGNGASCVMLSFQTAQFNAFSLSLSLFVSLSLSLSLSLVTDGAVTVRNTTFVNDTTSVNILYKFNNFIQTPIVMQNIVMKGFNQTGNGINILGGATLKLDNFDASHLLNAIIGYPDYYQNQYEYAVWVANSRFYRNANAIHTIPNSNNPADASKGVVRVTSTRFQENGGGKFKSGGALMIAPQILAAVQDSSFIGNHVSDEGGAFYCDTGATLNIAYSSFAGNSANDGGNGWCDEKCAFLSDHVEMSGTKQSKDTHPCPGFPKDNTAITSFAAQQVLTIN
ncbi:hypothetical protein QOT17_006915 [Balamuthia mandrillaris]